MIRIWGSNYRTEYESVVGAMDTKTGKSKYENDKDVLFTDYIPRVLGHFGTYIDGVEVHEEVTPFPGIDAFRQRVVSLLEDELHFDVIEDCYDGIFQKGYTFDNGYSLVFGFDTYFELNKAADALISCGVDDPMVPEKGKVYVKIELGFPEHDFTYHNDLVEDLRIHLECAIAIPWIRKAKRCFEDDTGEWRKVSAKNLEVSDSFKDSDNE